MTPEDIEQLLSEINKIKSDHPVIKNERTRYLFLLGQIQEGKLTGQKADEVIYDADVWRKQQTGAYYLTGQEKGDTIEPVG